MSTSSDFWPNAMPVRDFNYPAVGAIADVPRHAELDAEEISRREQHARELGRREGEAIARTNYESALRDQRTAIAKALEEFRREREEYYARVESEVVQLSLAIARKILHREAQVDMLLLTGAVRVALSKLAEGTLVQMRTAPAAAPAWRSFLSESSQNRCSVQVMEDSTLVRDECVLETEVGTIQMSVEAQLKEIEHGLFDLLAQRPENGK